MYVWQCLNNDTIRDKSQPFETEFQCHCLKKLLFRGIPFLRIRTNFANDDAKHRDLSIWFVVINDKRHSLLFLKLLTPKCTNTRTSGFYAIPANCLSCLWPTTRFHACFSVCSNILSMRTPKCQQAYDATTTKQCNVWDTEYGRWGRKMRTQSKLKDHIVNDVIILIANLI